MALDAVKSVSNIIGPPRNGYQSDKSKGILCVVQPARKHDFTGPPTFYATFLRTLHKGSNVIDYI